MEPDTATATERIDQYCRAWGEPDPGMRARILHGLWPDDASYTDPTVHAACRRDFLAHLAAVQSRRPGSRVVRTGPADVHHARAAFLWHAVGADGAILRQGIDFVEFTADGSAMRRVVGFFGAYRL